MTDALAALPSPTLPIRHESDHDGAPETKSLAFNEVWQDKEEGLTFGDVLDIVNPLQHIPVVSTIYRMVTGDEIGMGARLAGGALYGSALGVAAAGIVAGLEEASGGTVEQHIASLFEDDDADVPAEAVTAAVSGTVSDKAAAADTPETPVLHLAAAGPEIPVLTAAQAAFLTNLAPAAGKPAAASTAPASVAPALVSAATVSPKPVSEVPALPVAAKAMSDAAPAADAQGAEFPPRADRAGETASARVAREIAEAQRAQAGLLLASLQAEGAAKQLTASGDTIDQEAESPAIAPPPTAPQNSLMPFRSHPYMLPPGAPSSLVASTMERALQRYHQSLQRQTPPPAAPAPAMAPAATPRAASAP